MRPATISATARGKAIDFGVETIDPGAKPADLRGQAVKLGIQAVKLVREFGIHPVESGADVLLEAK